MLILKFDIFIHYEWKNPHILKHLKIMLLESIHNDVLLQLNVITIRSNEMFNHSALNVRL